MTRRPSQGATRHATAPPVAVEPVAAAAWTELRQALDEAEPMTVPCIRLADRDWWWSTIPAHRQAAAHLCGTCPLLDQCHAYAVAGDERWGVWGGLDRGRRG